MVGDKDVVMAIILSEASVEGEEGIQAVINTIVNRSRGDNTIGRFRDVVTKENAYEGYTLRKKKKLSEFVGEYKDFKNPDTEKQWYDTEKLLDEALAGELEDITGGATHYLNPELQKAEWRPLPDWALMAKTKQIGSHLFGVGLTKDELKELPFEEAFNRARSIMGSGHYFEYIDREEFTTMTPGEIEMHKLREQANKLVYEENIENL